MSHENVFICFQLPQKDTKTVRADELTFVGGLDVRKDGGGDGVGASCEADDGKRGVTYEFMRDKQPSKTKKVKNYLKKCKSTANSFIHAKSEPNGTADADFRQRRAIEEAVPLTSWYVTDEFYLDEEPRNHVTIVQISDTAQNGVQKVEYDGVADVCTTRVERDSKVVRLSGPKGATEEVPVAPLCPEEEEVESLENFIGNSPAKNEKRCCDLSVSVYVI